jgi:hypothetical protein
MSTEILDLEEKQNNKLPVFLKVLCILTYVGAGIGILSGIYGILTFNSSLQQMEQTQELFEMSDNRMFGDMSEFLEVNRKWGFTVQIMAFVGNLLCLFGALYMWKLKKIGFYLYVPGQIIPLIGSFGLMGGLSASGGMFAGIAVVASIIGALFPIAFIIMYAVNLKHLK